MDSFLSQTTEWYSAFIKLSLAFSLRGDGGSGSVLSVSGPAGTLGCSELLAASGYMTRKQAVRKPRKDPPEATMGMTRTLPTASTTAPRAEATKIWLM